MANTQHVAMETLTISDDQIQKQTISGNCCMLGKYSRFHHDMDAVDNARTVQARTLSSFTVRYTSEFRELIFGINPYNISCLYKAVFENHSTSSLLVLEDTFPDFPDDDVISETDSKSWGTKTPWEVFQAKHFPKPHEQTDVSNSAIHLSSCSSTKSCEKLDFRGWDICVRAHSAGCIYQKDEGGSGEGSSRNSKVPHSEISYCVVNNLKGVRSCNTTSKIRIHGHQRKVKPESPCGEDSSRSSTSCSLMNVTPIKVGKQFTHNKPHDRYISQYREEYTYKRLKDIGFTMSEQQCICPCRNPSCPVYYANMAQVVPRWCPSARQRFLPMQVKCRPQRPQQCCRQPAMKKHPVQVRKTITPPIKKPVLRVEMFSSPLIVNSYNPTKKSLDAKSPTSSMVKSRTTIPNVLIPNNILDVQEA